jgi:hypothetical protein
MGDERDEITKADLEMGTCRIWNGDVFYGTAIMYAASDRDCFPVQCYYELSTLYDQRLAEGW